MVYRTKSCEGEKTNEESPIQELVKWTELEKENKGDSNGLDYKAKPEQQNTQTGIIKLDLSSNLKICIFYAPKDHLHTT